MASPTYVHEKMSVAVGSMCDDRPFASRLESAALTLHMLNDDDLDGEAAANLAIVLDWTKRNLLDGRIQRLPDDDERAQLIDAMVATLCDTTTGL